MEELGVRLDDEERRAFFEFVDERVRTPHNTEANFQDHFSFNSSVMWKHRKGENSAMSFDIFSELYSVVYQSDSRYDLSSLDRYVRNATRLTPGFNEDTLNRGRGPRTRLRERRKVKKIFSDTCLTTMV